jgi:hypothetical protein
MKYIKQFETLTDIIYHFTFANSLFNILKTNQINLTPIFGTNADMEINAGKMYTLSLTSSRSSDVGYAASLPKRELVRITFNGRELNYNFKSKRVDYWQHPKDPKKYKHIESDDPKNIKNFYKHIARQNELEDRIVSDKNTITPANKYIQKIEILNIDIEKAEIIKWYCDKLNIPLYIYDQDKYFDASYIKMALDIQPKEGDLNTDRHSQFWNIEGILGLLTFKDPELEKTIFDEISEKFNIDVESIKKKNDEIKEKNAYYLNSGDFYIEDKAHAISADIHNLKRSTNELFRFIIHKFALDMKKNNAKTIKEYINYKVWKGKKTQKDFNKELNNKIQKLIDKTYSNELKEKNNYSYYDENGDYHNNIFEYKPIKIILDDYVSKIKKYCSDYILNNGDMFKYSYMLSSSELKNVTIGIVNKLKDTISNLEHIEVDDILPIIQKIIWEIDNIYYNEIKSIQEEFYN